MSGLQEHYDILV